MTSYRSSHVDLLGASTTGDVRFEQKSSGTLGNLFLWELIPLEQSLPVDGEIQAWIKESGFEAGEEEKMIIEYPEEKQ